MSAENNIQLHTQRWAHEFVVAVHARLDAGAGRDLRVRNQTTRRTASAWLSRRALRCKTRYPGPGRLIQAACVRGHPVESQASIVENGSGRATQDRIRFSAQRRTSDLVLSRPCTDASGAGAATVSSPSRAYRAWIATMVGMRLAVGAHKQTCERGIHTERSARRQHFI
ncbi:hypothetical protein B0H11DRAFT_1934953 [Mycena galericulata]|nr:hypothetical protein B0H11DRAFT_1934953 [Mycena galericulata]